MNFKTTIILLILLLGVGTAVIIIHYKSPSGQTDNSTVALGEADRLIDMQSDQVTGLSIVDADGNRVTAVKDGSWRMTEPVKAGAVDYAAMDLVRHVLSLRSAEKQDVSAADAGLDAPKYQVELTAGGKTSKLSLGRKTQLGDQVYAQADGGGIHLIDTSLLASLNTAADDLRDKHLLSSVQQADVRQWRITRGKTKIAAAKNPLGEWKLTSPTPMPADQDGIDQLVSGILGTEAVSFLKPNSPELAFAGFDHPTAVVWLSTADAAATQPSGTQVTLTIGAPDGPAKTNYYVQLSNGNAAKIGADALANFTKNELDLRDKNVLLIKPDEVTQIKWTNTIYPPTTTAPSTGSARPATRPAIVQTVILRRRPLAAKPMGPDLPTSLPSTLPTTGPSPLAMGPLTQPSTQPAEQSTWEYVAPFDSSKQVDENKMNNMLARFSPEHANQFFASAPAWLPSQQIVLTFTIQPPGRAAYDVTVQLFGSSDQANKPYGELGGTIYEVDPLDLTVLQGDFLK